MNRNKKIRALADGNGTIIYYKVKTSEYHNLKGPAIIQADGTEEYLQNDKKHRIDGPAVINKKGTVEYFKKGKYYRKNGPIRIDTTGEKHWNLNH